MIRRRDISNEIVSGCLGGKQGGRLGSREVMFGCTNLSYCFHPPFFVEFGAGGNFGNIVFGI